LGNGGNKLDIGINTIMDKAGAFNNLYVSGAIGYSLRIAGAHNLSLAITGGYSQKSLDINNLTFDDQYVHGSYSSSNATSETVLYDKINYADVGFGLLWSSDYSRSESSLNGYIGVSGHHLNMPKESLTGETGVLLRRYTYLGGIKIFGENLIDFTPNIILSSQGGAYEAAVGLYLDLNFSDEGKLTVGCWYRDNDAIACLIKFDYKFFVVGYSYDIPNSGLGRAIPGLNTHEVSLSFKIHKKEKDSSLPMQP